MRSYWVYILASKPRGTLYVGVTNDLAKRTHQHKTNAGAAFTKRYRVSRLVHAEEYADIRLAIEREKRLKRWRRAWKIELIEEHNPDWSDLYENLNA